MKTITILFVNHREQKCGVYEFGKSISEVLKRSKKYNFVYCEADNWDEFHAVVQNEKPAVIIYNYYPSTMGWISNRAGLSINSHKIRALQIGLIHEVTQEIANNSTNIIFDYHIAADPTLLLANPIVYKTGRLIPRYQSEPSINKITTIGSFGFATNGKGFIKIVDKVQEEFDTAIINLNISFAKFGDESGNNARKIAEEARKRLTKSGITLNVSHDHLSTQGILKFLSKNDLNVFLYDYQGNRGIASATDWAIAAKRPLALTRSSMFRHLFDCYPSMCIEDNSLKTILENTTTHLERLCEEWCPENLLWDYERILDDIIIKNESKRLRSPFQKRLALFLHLTHVKRIEPPASTSPWLKNNGQNIFGGFIHKEYQPVGTDVQDLNQILNNNARERYKAALGFIKEAAPEIIARKIPEANIQQAFVFDTVYNRSKSKKQSMRILSVGAFEDTAAIALKKLGFLVDQIDPVMNYALETYITKPSVKRESYDIIMSTSVLEHVEDDEKFINQIAYLLKVGGWGILTCDFRDDYKRGADIPNVDYRLYTKKDLSERLLMDLPNCKIVGNPDWNCNDYDFVYLNRYRYTFASFIFAKISS